MHRPRVSGFTVIELLVVLAAIALLLSIAAPRYMRHVDSAREVASRESLHQMRLAIDRFYTDQGRYPQTLGELVERRYLRSVPVDPMTERADTWRTVGPPGEPEGQAVFDVRSGAADRGGEGDNHGG